MTALRGRWLSLNRAEGESVESTIDALAERVGELAEVGNEPSRHTVASYEQRWRQWQQFADHLGIPALPADPLHVAAFVWSEPRRG